MKGGKKVCVYVHPCDAHAYISVPVLACLLRLCALCSWKVFCFAQSERRPKRLQMLRGRRGEAVKITVVELEAVINEEILGECWLCAFGNVGVQFGCHFCYHQISVDLEF